MKTQAELTAFCRKALAEARKVKGVLGAEVFASDNAYKACRLCYSSHIPCNGVEEAKNVDFNGYSVRLVLPGKKHLRIGYAMEQGFDLAGIRAVIARARDTAADDAEFVRLPTPDWGTKAPTHRPRSFPAVTEKELVASGWRAINSSLARITGSKTLAKAAEEQPGGWPDLGVIVSGDISIRHDRVAVASTALPEPVCDESFHCRALITVMVEALDAKGTGFEISTDISSIGAKAGSDAAQSTLDSLRGNEVPSGSYPVVLSRFAVKDLMDYMVIPSLSAFTFHASMSAFMGKAGKLVAAPSLSIRDDALTPGLAYNAAFTDDGLPAGRTDLIKNGVLTGLLCSDYEARRMLTSKDSKTKLGIAPERFRQGLVPRNGFKPGGMARRCFEGESGGMPTNAVVEGSQSSRSGDLLKKIKNGLYIGRIWYTYPVNGLSAGDFSSTVVGSSHIIKNGRIVGALKPNSLRINDNIRSVLQGIIGFGRKTYPIQGWTTPFLLHTPEIAVRGMRFDRVCAGMSE